MIARALIPLLLVIVLPDLWLYLRYVRRSPLLPRLLWWLPAAALTALTVNFAREPNFVPVTLTAFEWYLFIIAFAAAPKALYVICSAAGRLLRRRMRRRFNWGNPLGALLVLICWIILIDGVTVGNYRLKVETVDITSPDVPPAFDGYRLLHLSDMHVGTYSGSLREQSFLALIAAIDSLSADAVCFTGDLINSRAEEIIPHLPRLRSLARRRPVFAVLGNHDYSKYLGGGEREKRANEAEVRRLIRSAGWRLLLNSHEVLRRGGDSVIVAGSENWDARGYPDFADFTAALRGVGGNNGGGGRAAIPFIIMLQHEPAAWRRHILPETAARLTLSGHTHAGQAIIAGWSPVALFDHEWNGLYNDGLRWLNVSRGLGAVIPFRFNCPRTIYVITLHSRKKNRQ